MLGSSRRSGLRRLRALFAASIAAAAFAHVFGLLAGCGDTIADPNHPTTTNDAAIATDGSDVSPDSTTTADVVTSDVFVGDAQNSIDAAPDPACVPPSPPTDMLAQSAFGFSDAQSRCGWTYRYASPASPTDSVLTPLFDGTQWFVTDVSSAGLSRGGGHPGAGYTMVRRWVSTYNGNIRIRGNVKGVAVAQGGNGVVFTVFRNQTSIKSVDLVSGMDAVDINITSAIALGDTIDFAVGAKGEATFDTITSEFEIMRD